MGTGQRGFTLIELLTVISIILILCAILIPVIGSIRTRSMTAAARSTVSALYVAVEEYRQEDARHKYPPQASSGDLLLYETNGAQPRQALNLLEVVGYQPPAHSLEVSSGTVKMHVDPWRRGFHYQLDAASSGGAVKPANLADWNPTGLQPYPYFWSIGKIRGTDAADALPANASGYWIYRTAGL